jgi:hypothetical protein
MTSNEPGGGAADVSADARTVLSHAEMRELQTSGLAMALSRHVTDVVRYDDRWWIADRLGWTLVTEQRLIATLDRQSTWTCGGLYR